MRPGRRELAQEPQHAVDLDVVEVRGRLVGEEQRRIEREGAGDGDPLLLTTRKIAGPVMHAVLEADLAEHRFGTSACASRARTFADCNAICTFSRAVRLGIRLNAWNTMPTVWRRYSTSWWPRSAVTSMSPKRIAAVRRREQLARASRATSSCRSRSRRAAAPVRRSATSRSSESIGRTL